MKCPHKASAWPQATPSRALAQGAVGFDGLQSLEDLRNKWNRLMDVAGRTPEERAATVALFQQKVEKVPGTEVG